MDGAPLFVRDQGCATRQLGVAVITRAGAVFSLAVIIAIVDLVLTGANALRNW